MFYELILLAAPWRYDVQNPIFGTVR
jgi:hypothetical protein